jgi:undecaprenyl-diphosphatase
MLLVLLYKSVRHQRWQQGITGGILLLILLVGCSRIYLGMHWLSDVLGGYALGGAYCLLASTVYARLERGAKVPDDLDER